MTRGAGIFRGFRRLSAGWLLVLGVVCVGACSPSEHGGAPSTIPIMGAGGVPAGGVAGSGGAGSGGASGAGGDSSTGGAPIGGDAGAVDVPVVSLSAPGTSCASDAECGSGFCVDKVCCATRCDGICQSCALAGSLGICLPAEVGTDPRNDCPDEMPGSCARDGACDGAGQCRTYPVGTICKPASCVGSTLTAASRCGGEGCTSVMGQPCAPFMCGTMGTCLTKCATDKDCVSPNTCLSGRCGKKPLGDTCATDNECNSAHCAQGVCCGTACTANCSSCALAGSEGRCTPVPPGLDPLDQCMRDDPMTCGLDGTCDGAGQCRNYSQGTICKTAACAGTTLTPQGSCDGKKMCQMPLPISCGDYTCDTNARCRTTCATPADCASPAVCTAGVCGGILAKYFSDITLTNLVLTRVEATLDNDWGAGGPPGLPVDNFSARYTAMLTPRFSETYTFYVLVDDGTRVWVNDAPIIDDWNGHAALEDTGTVALQANVSVSIRIEYMEKMGDAQILFSWSSPSEPKAIVPTARMSPRM
ncbi:MAG TPA: PA14 domain-containing protein [Polyangia bacterium]|nr:PA14 domain-containing protein [Polyangia bacterium]